LHCRVIESKLETKRYLLTYLSSLNAGPRINKYILTSSWNKLPLWMSCFFRLFWIGQKNTSLRLVLFRLRWTRAMFFNDSSDMKFGTFLHYVFHNMINGIGSKKYQQNCGSLFPDRGSILFWHENSCKYYVAINLLNM